MPQLGESVTEGTIGKWLVKPGDSVKEYQPIAEVITDKVNAEIPAPQTGEILTLEVPEGETVHVGTLIATMRAAGEAGAVAAPAAPAPAATPAAVQAPAPAAPIAAAAVAPARGTAPVTEQPAALGGGRFSPAVMRLAGEYGIDLARVPGTGLGGRITRKDIEAYVAAGGAAQAAPAAAPVPAAASAPVAAPAAPAAAPARAQVPAAPLPAPLAEDQVVPVDPVRRRIAEKMLQSKHEAPHAWSMVQVDVTGLVKLKELEGAEFKRREGVSFSFVPFFIKAVVESLREYPRMNSQWAGENIIIKKDLNISIAVATETALAVPVIKNADRYSITGLNHAVADLAGKARANKLTMDDISGGTFTVNNTGYFGSFASAPIINYPQAAIMSFEAITKMPVVLPGDAIAIRSMMNMCVSMDHRVLDGLVCGRFMQAVKKRLESYGPGTVSLY